MNITISAEDYEKKLREKYSHLTEQGIEDNPKYQNLVSIREELKDLDERQKELQNEIEGIKNTRRVLKRLRDEHCKALADQGFSVKGVIDKASGLHYVTIFRNFRLDKDWQDY